MFQYSISQNLKDMLKNRIKILISPILYNLIDFMVDNLFVTNAENTYFGLISTIQSSVRETIKKIIISTFEEIDENYKNSPERLSSYYVNKSNVSRTLITIVGEITFSRTYYKCKCSNKKFFFIDKVFELPKYDHYDPIVKAMAVNNAINTSQAQASRDISTFAGDLKYFVDSSSVNLIPRQSIHNWIKEWHTPNIVPESIDTPETLYVMADEKYIGAQDIKKDIMVKCFVTFEDIKDISKHRRALVNRSVFSCYNSHAWPLFMDYIAKRYDFSKIKNIALLADGGSWIKTGLQELRLDANNHVKFYLCEFHFKHAINQIASNDDERKNLLEIFTNKKKKDFVAAVNEIIEKDKNREKIITKKLNYILNNYSSIKAMLELTIGSSMESHISHLIASFFSSRPKGFSTKRIDQYLKLNDYKNNGINIFRLYMQSYNNEKVVEIGQEEANSYIFDNSNRGNIPILNDGHITETYKDLKSLVY